MDEEMLILIQVLGQSKGAIMATNREKINKMTNEELANTLAYRECCSFCAYDNTTSCNNESDCQKGILQWLNKESGEE